MVSLQNKHVLITGASRGLGRALALACHQRGARLSVCARSSAPLMTLAAETGAVGAALDVSDAPAVERWMAAAVSQYGQISAVINNAAILGPMLPLKEYPLETFSRVLDVNVRGPVVVIQAALPHLVRPGGVICQVTSYLGHVALPGYGAYCASKFAIEGLTALLAEEHGDQGLVSCMVDPGMVQSEMLQAALGQDDVSDYPTAATAGEAFAAVLERLTSADNGRRIDLFPAPTESVE